MGWNVIEERRTSGGITTKKNFVWGLDLSQSMDGAGGIGGLPAVVDQAGTQIAFLYRGILTWNPDHPYGRTRTRPRAEARKQARDDANCALHDAPD